MLLRRVNKTKQEDVIQQYKKIQASNVIYKNILIQLKAFTNINLQDSNANTQLLFSYFISCLLAIMETVKYFEKNMISFYMLKNCLYINIYI